MSTGREYVVDLSLAATKKHIENSYETKEFVPFDVTDRCTPGTHSPARSVFLRISELVSVEEYAA